MGRGYNLQPREYIQQYYNNFAFWQMVARLVWRSFHSVYKCQTTLLYTWNWYFLSTVLQVMKNDFLLYDKMKPWVFAKPNWCLNNPLFIKEKEIVFSHLGWSRGQSIGIFPKHDWSTSIAEAALLQTILWNVLLSYMKIA